MSQKKFHLIHSKHESGLEAEGGGSVTLHLRADVPALCNSFLAEAVAYHAELSKEIADALAVETPAANLLAARRAEMREAEDRLASLTGRQQVAQAEREHAIETGDLAAADHLAAEISALPAQISNAERRVSVLKQNAYVYEAEQAFKNEQASLEQRIRQRRQQQLAPKLEEAKRKLAAAVERAYAELAAVEELDYIARTGREPAKSFYKLSPSELAAFQEKIDAENRKISEYRDRARAEAERKALEENERRQHQKYQAEQVAADSPGLVAWARGFGKWPW